MKLTKALLCILVAVGMPHILLAQDGNDGFRGLQQVLERAAHVYVLALGTGREVTLPD